MTISLLSQNFIREAVRVKRIEHLANKSCVQIMLSITIGKNGLAKSLVQYLEYFIQSHTGQELDVVKFGFGLHDTTTLIIMTYKHKWLIIDIQRNDTHHTATQHNDTQHSTLFHYSECSYVVLCVI